MSASSRSPATSGRQQRPHRLDAGGALHRRRPPSITEIAKDFLNFVATPEACDIITEAVGATGPYLIEGCELPDDVPRPVADMMPYFERGGPHRPGAGVPVADQGPGAGAAHRRGRLGHPRRRRAPPSSTTRTSPSRRGSWACRTGKWISDRRVRASSRGRARSRCIDADGAMRCPDVLPIPTGSSCPPR